MERYEADCVVVGAGAVGLAVARKLAREGRDVLVLEAERAIGTGISSRNSEVVHAGIYYPPGSVKAQTCVAGRDLLYAYLESRKILYRRCGKLVVASSQDDRSALETIAERGHANGVVDLEWIGGDMLRSLEPALSGVAALHSPSSGIFDTHGYMLSLQGEIEDAGGKIAFATGVERIEERAGKPEIVIAGNAGLAITAHWVVNAAGLGAIDLAMRCPRPTATSKLEQKLARGNYFMLQGRNPFSRLIYPVPEPGGLGVHLTLDLTGRARFGPDVEWIDREDYVVDPERADRFYAAVRRYWPALAAGSLVPDYAGIRPKLYSEGKAIEDFILEEPVQHGVQGVVHLLGIESPGLTASLAIADQVFEKMVEY